MPWSTTIIILLSVGVLHVLGALWAARRSIRFGEYLLGNGMLGTAGGVTVLLGFWVTGNTLLAAPETTYEIGVLGMVGYSVVGSVALILFAPVARQLAYRYPGASARDFFRIRYDQRNAHLYTVLYLAFMMGVLVTQGAAGALFLAEMSAVPYSWGITLTFATAIIYATISGLRGIAGLALYQVLTILVVVLIVPGVVLLQIGAPSLYQGVMQNAPQVLDVASPAGWWFLLTGSFLGLGEVIMDNTFWQRLQMIRRERVAAAFTLAGIGWFFIPGAFSILAFVALATGTQPTSLTQVPPLVALRFAGEWAAYLVLLAVWIAVISTIASELIAAVHLILSDQASAHPGGPAHRARWITVGLGVLAAVVSLVPMPSLIGILLFFGVLNGAYIAPVIAGLISSRVTANTALLSVVLGIALGYMVYFTLGAELGILTSTFAAAAVCAAGILVSKRGVIAE